MPKRADKSARHSQAPADLVDQQLARYRGMRDFAMTAEPRGSSQKKPAAEPGLPFVIQKHAATRLHYDFRLGWRGVLKSWAVTRGPSYNVKDKRLAVEVEDHPMEYGGFEGTIPKGQYGGGTVMVWDHGTWEPHVDVDEGLRKGQLKFGLHGHKLQGNWALIRMAPRGTGHFARQEKPSWLLIKEHDEYERGPEEPCITDEAPDSALTGRNLEQIAESEDHVWNSHVPEKSGRGAPPTRASKTREKTAATVQEVPALNRYRLTRKSIPNPSEAAPDCESLLNQSAREKMPGFVSPELAISVTEPPEGDAWLHELKLDGYRIQAHITEKGSKQSARLFTRNGLDWTHRMRAVAEAAAALPVHSAILDGEVVVLDAEGHTSFAELQAAFDEGKPNRMTYWAFDLLHLDGHNLRSLSLEARKAILEDLLRERGEDPTLRYSSHIRGHGHEMFENACNLGAEGIVSKLASAPYRSERSRAWLKAKCVRQQEFVIGGYTPYKGGKGVGALLLGYYHKGELAYAGRTGTGFTQKMREEVEHRLEGLRQPTAPFHHPPAGAKKNAIWVRPELVAEARFATWTSDHRVRQAAFLGIREDKDPKEVVREDATPVPKGARKNRQTENSPAADAPSKESDPPQEASGHAAEERETDAKSPPTNVMPIEESRKSAQAKHTPPASANRSAAAVSSRHGRAEVAGVSISHPDKILDEQSRLTKLQLAEYYAAIADHLLPHIANRPLSLVRCPEGSGKPCFFQKHIGMGVPHGIESVPVTPKNGGAAEQYLTLSTPEGLIGLAQMGVLEIHPWGSHNQTLEHPDRIIVDLDPDPRLAWERLVESAVEVRDLFRQVGLETFVKSTGGKGIHVVAPIRPRLQWPAVKDFAHNFVLMMERANPELYLTRMTKSARAGRIFLDYLRNERGATAVAPYSPRARAGARVAMPLTWAELKRTDPKQFTTANYHEWKARLRHDPWSKMNEIRQDLTDRAVAAVAGMLGHSR